ncbi:MAG: dienelactone hydrolase [Bacteroidota bacterium]|nr:dienelactone hydrolase [Bacteroidota bacterium]
MSIVEYISMLFMKNFIAILCLILLNCNMTTHAQLKPVKYTDGNQKLNGFSILPKDPSKNKAGVLILPAWMGIDKHSQTTAERLSALGYYAFVADIYGEGNYPKDMKAAGERAGYYKSHYTDYQKRIRLAMEQLVLSGADPNKIVVIGYCFGGTGAIEAARANMPVQGVVCFHGSLGWDASRKISAIQPKILICHGADDPYSTESDIKEFVKELNDSNADWQIVLYSNSVHSFTDTDAGNDNSK